MIPVGGYTDNRKQGKKAIAWLMLEEGGQEDPAREERQGAPAARTAGHTFGRLLRGDAHIVRVQWVLLARS